MSWLNTSIKPRNVMEYCVIIFRMVWRSAPKRRSLSSNRGPPFGSIELKLLLCVGLLHRVVILIQCSAKKEATEAVTTYIQYNCMTQVEIGCVSHIRLMH